MAATAAQDVECIGDDGSAVPALEYCEAIAESFYETPEALDIRPLWTKDVASYFRVNFWRLDRSAREERIYRSAFVAVELTAGGLRVDDLTERAAA